MSDVGPRPQPLCIQEIYIPHEVEGYEVVAVRGVDRLRRGLRVQCRGAPLGADRWLSVQDLVAPALKRFNGRLGRAPGGGELDGAVKDFMNLGSLEHFHVRPRDLGVRGRVRVRGEDGTRSASREAASAS